MTQCSSLWWLILCVNMTVTQIKHYTQVYLWRCFSRWDGIPVGGLSRLPSSVWVGIIQPVSVNQFSYSVVSNSLQPHGLQHARLPCPSPTSGACSNSCPLSQWWHPSISSSVVPFSSCLQSFPESGSIPMSQFFTTGGQSFGVSALASVLSMNIQGWIPLGLTSWISM